MNKSLVRWIALITVAVFLITSLVTIGYGAFFGGR